MFEVYKWLMYETYPAEAQRSLQRMRYILDIAYPAAPDLDEITTLISSMPTWRGALEDATVAITALRLDVPVWTLNFRDLAAFRNLQFWTPDAG